MRQLIAFVIAFLACGCVSTGRVQHELEHRMLEADYAGAVTVVDEEQTGVFDGKNRLLYYLERGMLLHVDGDHEASNAAFERAKHLARSLEARSVSDAGLSLLTNDLAVAYAGEDFERTLIHLFSALNYQQMGDLEAALVEARQVADSLRKLDLESGGNRVYRDDAFARYLSAMLFEAEGNLERAFVDYKKATSAYREYEKDYGVEAPSTLFAHAERVAEKLGAWAIEDLEALGGRPSRAARLPTRSQPKQGLGEIIVLHYNGLSPIKREDRFTIPVSEAWFHASVVQATASPGERAEIERAFATFSQLHGVDFIPIAFPRFQPRRYSIDRMAPRVTGSLRVTDPDLVEDIGAIAFDDLEDRIDRIQAKAIVRAAIKWGIQKAFEAQFERMENGDGDLLRTVAFLGGNAARHASERADDRVWSTLPDTIWMSSILVPEGTHDVTVDFIDRRHRVIEERTIRDVRVEAGEREFVIVRTVQ